MVNWWDDSAFHQKQQVFVDSKVQESEIKEDKLAYQSPLPLLLEEQNLAQLI